MLISMIVAASLAHGDADQQACAGALQLVESAYVDGIWRNRDRAAVDAGFHEGFVMQARRDGAMRSMSIDDWIGGWPEDIGPNEDSVDADLSITQCEGSLATVRVDLRVNGSPRFVDLFGLYRFGDDWKIVTKLYEPQ